MESFAHWLTTIGLERYASVLAQNEIDFDVLASVTETDLQSIGLPLGARKRLLLAAARLNGHNPAATASPVPAAAPLAGERRQLTVMFCDLVGSTALSVKLDPEELRALLHDYRMRCEAVIARYDGSVMRYVGDGILIYFGWPTAHEEDAERALRAALDIVAAVKDIAVAEPLAVRIGIATGPVVVGEQAGIGNESRLAIGSTPNLAARLQGIAENDQIIVASSTRRLVGKTFELADLGEYELRGIAEPVHAWRVLALSIVASRFEAATQGQVTPLVGREQELALLLDRWQQAREGKGQVVLLSGEAGIGKSRVSNALRVQLEAQGAAVLRLQCSPYHVNTALYPSIDNLERALKFGRDESPAARLDKLEALAVNRYGRPLADVRFIAGLLSIPCDERYGALPMTPQKHKDELQRALVDLSIAAAQQRPAVLLLEDAHWADPTTLEVMGQLIERIKNVPMLIVLTHRPELQPKWNSHDHVTTLNLSRLTRAQSSAIVDKLTRGKALPADLLRQILVKADGVPLYVEELTRAILESGELNEAGDRFEYGGDARTVTLPATLRDLLMARLDRHPLVKEIAQIGAAIGRRFSYELIAAVAPHAPADLNRALRQFASSGLGLRRGTPPEAVYSFKHTLLQDAAYDSLLKSRKQTLHARIAGTLETHFPERKDTEPELLARHLTAAGQAAAAIAYWQKAGRIALKRLALREAIAHLNSGMELITAMPPSATRDELELNLRTALGTATIALKGWTSSDVWSAFHPALALAKSLRRDDTLLPIYLGLWVYQLCQCRIGETLAWSGEMLASAQASGDSDLLIVGHRAACATYFYRGDFVTAREHGEQVFALYDEVKHHPIANITNVDPKTSAGIHMALGAWILGYPQRALEISNETEAHARRRGHPFDIGWALTFGAMVWNFRSEPAQVFARVDEGERLGRTHRLPFITEVLAYGLRAIALLRDGSLEEGIPKMGSAIERWRAGGGELSLPYYRALLAEGFALKGDLDRGLRLIDDCVAQIARPTWEERWYAPELPRLQGWMLQQQNKLAAAQACYLSAIDAARLLKAKSWELRAATNLAQLWLSQDQRLQARELLAPIYEWFGEGDDTVDLKTAKNLLEQLGA